MCSYTSVCVRTLPLMVFAAGSLDILNKDIVILVMFYNQAQFVTIKHVNHFIMNNNLQHLDSCLYILLFIVNLCMFQHNFKQPEMSKMC